MIGPVLMPFTGLPDMSSLAGSVSAGLPLAAFSIAGVSQETLLLLATYLALAGAYLFVVPLALYWWMNRRWTLMGKLERTAIYGMVFLFFPGLILFAPFLNFRMAGSGDGQA